MTITSPPPHNLWTDMSFMTLKPHPLFYIIKYVYTRIIDNQFVVNKVHLIEQTKAKTMIGMFIGGSNISCRNSLHKSIIT